jgi:hypothetical protein
MSHRALSVVRAICVATLLLVTPAGYLASATLAQGTSVKPGSKITPPSRDAAREVEEYVDVHRQVSGPAGNPECFWLGRRVVSLLWRDDLETAFRHLDLYDRFGCPGNHIETAFRCLILHADSIDPKAPDSLNGRVQACWINPAQPAPPAPAAAAGPGGPTTKH